MKVRVVNFFGALTLTLSHFVGEGIGLLRTFLMSAQLLLLSIIAPVVTSAAELRTVPPCVFPIPTGRLSCRCGWPRMPGFSRNPG